MAGTLIEMEGVAEVDGPYFGISKSWQNDWLLGGGGADLSNSAPDVCFGEGGEGGEGGV